MCAFHNITKTPCDTSQVCPKALLLPARRYPALPMVYNLAHPSVAHSVKLVTERLLRFTVKRGQHQWSCVRIQCQGIKVHQQPKAPLAELLNARQRHVHTHLVGSFPPSLGLFCILSCVGRLTRWQQAITLSYPTSEVAAKMLSAV